MGDKGSVSRGNVQASSREDQVLMEGLGAIAAAPSRKVGIQLTGNPVADARKIVEELQNVGTLSGWNPTSGRREDLRLGEPPWGPRDIEIYLSEGVVNFIRGEL